MQDIPAVPASSLTPLTAVSAIDGRYAGRTTEFRGLFSEYGLIKKRIAVEIMWFKCLAGHPAITNLPPLSGETKALLDSLADNFSVSDAAEVKRIEARTNHDVKAVEYYLQDRFAEFPALRKLSHFLHFAATSEDINSVSWGLIVREARDTVLLPKLECLLAGMASMADSLADTAMLARTHGQPASPTTAGKEFANFTCRLHEQLQMVSKIRLTGKFSGAVGNFNAHHIAYPEIDWRSLSENFVDSLGLEHAGYTAQTDPHDRLCELLDGLGRICSILIDFSRDIWGYIALGHIVQKPLDGEVGSSTMPHKVNPIDFENAEGNLGLARALASHMSSKLPISRWQRDLSDSSVQRSLGTVFGYLVIAIESLLRGLEKIRIDAKATSEELDRHWEVLAEALQTVLRKHGGSHAYERIKEHTRGRRLDADGWKQMVKSTSLPDGEKERLLQLEPSGYTGVAVDLARAAGKRYSSR